MASLNVTVDYECGKLNSIIIDDLGLEIEISAIIEKKIEEWFVPSNARDGWKGLKQEICDKACDDDAIISFEFKGDKKSREAFKSAVKKYDAGNVVEKISIDNKLIRYLDEAEKAKHKGYCDEELKYRLQAAELGHAESQYFVSQRIYKDKKTYNNEGIKWLERAADNNYADAQFNLGKCYYYGEGVGKNLKKAFEWFKKAALQGNAEAQYYLGNCYCFGNGIYQSKKKHLSGMKNQLYKETPTLS